LFVDEVTGGLFVAGLDRGAVAFEVFLFVFLEEDSGSVAEPRLDFFIEVEVFTVVGGRALELFDDQLAEVVDTGDLLRQRLDVSLRFAFRADRCLDEHRRGRRRDAGGVGAAAATVVTAAAAGDEERGKGRQK